MLKKLNYIFIILVAFILFFIKFSEFNTNYIVNVNQPYINYLNNHEDVAIYNVTFEFSEEESKKEYIQSIIYQMDRPSIFYHIETPLEGIQYTVATSFVYGDFDVTSYGIHTTEPIRDTIRFYISNDKSDTNNTNLVEFLDESYYELGSTGKLKTVLRPIDDLTEDVFKGKDSVNVFFIVDVEDQDVFVREIKDNYDMSLSSSNSIVWEYGDFNYSPESWAVDVFEMPRPILYISSVSLLIVLLLDFKKNQKEILVRKLHGNDANKIFNALFLKTIVKNILVLCVSLIVIYFYYVGTFSSLAIEFIRHLLPSLKLFVSVLFGTMILSYIILRIRISVLSLKKSNQHYVSFAFSVIIKIISITVLSVSLVGAYDKYITDRNYYKILKADAPTRDIIIFDQSTQEDLDINKKIFDIMQEHELGFRDMTPYGFLKWFYDDNSNVDPNDYNPNIPFIMVNQHSIKDYNFENEHGESIDIDKYKHINWILIPHRYREEVEENGIKCFDECEIVYYKNKVILSAFGTDIMTDKYESKMLYVMNVYHDSVEFAAGLTSHLIDGKMTESTGQAVDKIKEAIYPQRLSSKLGKDVYESSKDAYTESLTSLIVQLLITTFMISVFVYTYLMIYFDFKGKTLIIKYLNGVSFEKRYGFIFGMMIISNILTILVIMILSHHSQTTNFYIPVNLSSASIMGYTIFSLVVEGFVLSVGIYHFEKEKTTTLLKGDQV